MQTLTRVERRVPRQGLTLSLGSQPAVVENRTDDPTSLCARAPTQARAHTSPSACTATDGDQTGPRSLSDITRCSGFPFGRLAISDGAPCQRPVSVVPLWGGGSPMVRDHKWQSVAGGGGTHRKPAIPRLALRHLQQLARRACAALAPRFHLPR